MKILYSVLIVSFCAMSLLALWLPRNVNDPIKYFTAKKVFKLKLVPWYVDYNEITQYRIHFTENDWATEYILLNLEDLTPSFGYINPYLSDYGATKEEAMEYAKKFNSFEECVAHNEKLKHEKERLLRYYNDAGVPNERPKEKVKKLDKTEIIIK